MVLASDLGRSLQNVVGTDATSSPVVGSGQALLCDSPGNGIMLISKTHINDIKWDTTVPFTVCRAVGIASLSVLWLRTPREDARRGLY